MGWHDPANTVWELKVTPYYTYVQDYIDVDRCPVKAGSMSMTCSAMNQTTTNNFVYLQFANHDAWLAGVNIAGKVAVWDDLTYGRGVLRGTVGYVRGQRTDGIDLYHVMPINAQLGARSRARRLDQLGRGAAGRHEERGESGPQRADHAVLRAA